MKSSNFEGFDINNDQINIDFDQARLKNASYRIYDRRFREELTAVLSLPQRKIRSRLRTYVFEKRKAHRISTSALILLTHKFRELGDFDSIIRLYNECKNKKYMESPVCIENLANAYCRTGKYDKAIEMCSKISEHDFGDNSLRFNIEGTAHYIKATNAENLNYLLETCDNRKIIAAKRHYLKSFPEDPEFINIDKNEKESKLNALIVFQKGFIRNTDSFSGLRTATLYAELGNMKKAKEFAKLTLLTCERDGGLGVADYQRAETMVLAAALADVSVKQVNKFIDRICETPTSLSQRKATLAEMSFIKQSLQDSGKSTEFADAFIKTIRQKLLSVESLQTSRGLDAIFTLKNKKPKLSLTATQLLDKKTFSYRSLPGGFATSSCISGNFNFNGQVPDHTVSRVDWNQFNKLLDVPVETIIDNSRLEKLNIDPKSTLRKIDDPDIFSKVADQIVRSAFATEHRGIETLNNNVFDSYVNAVSHLGGISKLEDAPTKEKYEEKRASDSTTNISISFALGLGDCRHHAQVKQLLCDVWQRHKMTKDIHDAVFSILTDDEKNKDLAVDRFLKKLGTEFKTYDMEIIAPIDPNKRKEGFIYTGEPSKIEEHTGMLKFESDVHIANGMVSKQLKHVELCDPFYQGKNNKDKHIYTLSEGILKHTDIVKDIEGNVLLPGNTISAYDPKTKQNIDVEVKTRPVAYASNLDPAKALDIDRTTSSRLRLDYKDSGDNMYLVGLAIPTLDLPKKLIAAKQFRETCKDGGRYHPWLKKVHNWSEQNNKTTSLHQETSALKQALFKKIQGNVRY